MNNQYQPVNNNQYQPVNNTNQPVNNNQYSPVGGSDTVTAKLQELSKLRADGVISEEEFQAKRAEILSRF
jgi:cytochrome c-type biogenesis protein CcmH/NrfG